MDPMTFQDLKAHGHILPHDKLMCVKSITNVFQPGAVYSVSEDGMALLHVEDTGTTTPLETTVSKFVHLLDQNDEPFLPGEPSLPGFSPPDDVWGASDEHFDIDDILSEGPASDIVTRPSHYTSYAIEPITFIMRNGLPFWQGNIIKYAARAGKKIYDGMDEVDSEITDLEKVRRYAEMRINQLKGEEVL